MSSSSRVSAKWTIRVAINLGAIRSAAAVDCSRYNDGPPPSNGRALCRRARDTSQMGSLLADLSARTRGLHLTSSLTLPLYKEDLRTNVQLQQTRIKFAKISESNAKALQDWGNEKLQRAQKTVDESPYDLEAWSILIREAQIRPIIEVRPVFEKLVTVFPSAGRYWKIYIEQEMKMRNFEKVEKLFQRCLMKILNIELWKLYLSYVKETKASLTTYKEKMAQAYDFALDKIGMDIHSYSIWNDYVMFLKSVEAVGSYAENQKISAVRKVYQRGVINPMINMEQLWKDYMSFEQNINPIIAEKMAIERSRDYMNARRVAKELEAVTRGLNRSAPSIPPTGHPEEVKQVELWKKYIAWERSNPLRTEDTSLVARRVMFAIEQCLLCLGHHPAVWHQAAHFLELSSKILTEKGDVNAAKNLSDEAATMFERATNTLLSKNMLLYFAHADFEEGRVKYEKVHQIYQKFLDIPAYVQYMKFARRAEGIKSARTVFKRAREDIRCKHHVYVAAALMEYYCTKDKTIAFRIFELGLKKFGDNPDYILCYIDYLSHLNEDNNTRVLFERVLSSGSSLEPEKSVDIWNRFLEFESNIGDLASIVKVEKRRSAVLEKIKEFEGKETAQLVDRYKFLDLYPCTAMELRSIGYMDVSSVARNSIGVIPRVPDPEEAIAALPRPDLSQMIPYKPKVNPLPGEHPVPGGSFPLPTAAAQLCTILPPPGCFRGPFVVVDLLMDVFSRIQLPDHAPLPEADNGCDTKLFDLAKSVHWIVDESNDGMSIGSKRRRTRLGGDDSEEEDLPPPPINDIYRQRQQKRVK
ncbi:Protein suppressor of forked [Trachymyrmex septentrionalis]|uniref:Protein suppressor of forked n=2 Tax=Apocrita TaxID=7400 RepID=A0A195FYA3_9HYME|nr:Protein suppressor of forked [Trachymyrmex septentrionalis]